MEREELISKKDLLLATGISYGQLYRWKRQRLIPDSWFIKMSTYTGQETYFPKQKVLERINAILKMKDTYSLEELAEWFQPESRDTMYSLLDVRETLGLSAAEFDDCARVWGRSRFTFSELLLVDLFAELAHGGTIGSEEWEEALATAAHWSGNVAGGAEGKRVVVIRKRGAACFVYLEGAAVFRPDAGSELIGEFDLAERAKGLRIKLTEANGIWR